jgi:hypothetical protein
MTLARRHDANLRPSDAVNAADQNALASGTPPPSGAKRREFRHAELPTGGFDAARSVPGPSEITSTRPPQTDPAHLAGALNGSAQFGVDPHGGYEIRPAGNAVNLEDEMMKVAANQMDYESRHNALHP